MTDQYAALQQFIVERLQELDPTLDVSVGSRAYSALIHPLIRRLGTDPLSTDVHQFLTDVLRDSFPELDAQSAGSALRDVLVAPLVVMLEPLRREIEQARLTRSLADADTAAMTLEEADSLLANVLSAVTYGGFSTGSARVFFATARAVGVDQTVQFQSKTGIAYLPETARVYQPQDMTRSGNQWYIDIRVRSVEPRADARIGAGELVSVTNLAGAVRVTNPSAFEGGVNAQTVPQAVEAGRRSLAERSPVSKRAVERHLRENVPDLVSVEVVGFGDPAMQRDVLRLAAVGTPEDAVGAALFTASDTAAIVAVAVNGENNTRLPFTNQLLVSGIPAHLVPTLVEQTKFVRLFDAGGQYAAAPFGRARRVSRVEAVTSTSVRVTLADFVAGRTLTSTGVSTVDGAFNPFPWQGSAYRLFAADPDGTEWPTGAPLPVTDTVKVPGLLLNPEWGRDFLAIVSQETPGAPGVQPDGLPSPLRFPAAVRLYPIDAAPAANYVRVARADAFLLSRARLPGAWSGSLSEGAKYQAREERLEVIAFGGPASDADSSVAWDGTSLDAWARQPGVRLDVDTTDAGTDPVECTLSLHPSSSTTFTALGVQAGHFVAVLACPAGTTLADVKGSGARWTAWGRITGVATREMTVAGLDWTGLAGLAGFSTTDGTNVTSGQASAEYCLFWTVFVGQSELVDASGQQFTSFTELAFPPSVLQQPSTDLMVAAPGPTEFRPDGAALLRFNGMSRPDGLTAHGFSDGENPATAVWVRLPRSIAEHDPLTGGAPVDWMQFRRLCWLDSPALVVEGQEIPVSSPFTPSAALRALYPAARLLGGDTVALDNDTPSPATGLVLAQPAALPYATGHQLMFDGAQPELEDTADNPLKDVGFFVPSPFIGPVGAQLLAEQAPSSVSRQFTVAGIPGGVPFPSQYATRPVFESDQVHIGGALDAYVKPGATTRPQPIQLDVVPENTLDLQAVVFTGADGEIDYATPRQFKSTALTGWLAARFPLADLSEESVALGALSLELVNQPVGVVHTPLAVRITHNIVGTDCVAIDGEFDAFDSGVFQDVQFRVVHYADVSLERPTRTLQEGADLRAVAGERAVTIPSGVRFQETVGVVVRVGAPGNEEEFAVLSKSSTQLVLSGAPRVGGTGIPYRVFVTQPDAAVPAILRVTSAALGGADGTPVPYRHPVGLYMEALAGLGDDPLGPQDFGPLSLSEGATGLRVQATSSFSQQGIGLHDVVVLPELSEGDQFYHVVGVETVAEPGDRLLLDRLPRNVYPTTVSTYTLGHPAVGTLRAWFLTPTLFRVGPETLFEHVDANGVRLLFRPSPAEFAELSSPDELATDVLASVVGGALVLSSASKNWAACGIRAGDTVELVSRVLRSEAHTATDVAAAGRQLRLLIDGVPAAISFVGTDPLPLSAVVSRINQVLGSRVRASLVTDGPSTYLELASPARLEILGSSQASLLTALKLSVGENRVPGFGVDTEVQRLRHVAGEAYRLEAEAPADLDVGFSGAVFARVKRPRAQMFMPRDMQQVGGLHWADITVTSLVPRSSALVAPAGALQAVPSGDAPAYESVGYEVLTENPVYSFSARERLWIRVTSLVLPPTAATCGELTSAVRGLLSVQYETAPEVRLAQRVLSDPALRNMTSNPLARHFLPAYPVLSLVISGGISRARIEQELRDLFVSLYPNRPLVWTDVTDALRRAQVSRIQGPLRVGYLVHDADRRIRLLLSEDAVSLPAGYHVMGELEHVSIVGGPA